MLIAASIRGPTHVKALQVALPAWQLLVLLSHPPCHTGVQPHSQSGSGSQHTLLLCVYQSLLFGSKAFRLTINFQQNSISTELHGRLIQSEQTCTDICMVQH